MKIDYKILIVFTLLLFLMIGVTAAAENNTDKEITNDNEVISTTDNISSQNTNIKEETPVIKEPTKIVAKKVTGKQNKKAKLTAIVKNTKGQVVKNTKVTFKFNGKTYNAKTNNNGQATITVKLPKAKLYKTTEKIKGKKLTVKKIYKTIKKCTVTCEQTNDTEASKASFNVVSTKNTVVKKYKILSKKRYTTTLKVKNGLKSYYNGPFIISTQKTKKSGTTTIEVAAAKLNKGLIKFSIKHHYKKNGKWHWSKWNVVKKGLANTYSFGKQIKCDKVKITFVDMKTKRIK